MFWKTEGFSTLIKAPSSLVLFDIDGTLIFGGNIHRQAFEEALKNVCKIQTTIDWFACIGRTDQYILTDILTKFGWDSLKIKENLTKIMTFMGDWYAQHSDQEDGKLLPGVKVLLESLNKKHIPCGLVTGNVEKIAFYKLSHYDIAQYFSCGGFGSDDIDRSELLRIAIKKAEKSFSFKEKNHNVVYVADTIHDVMAARKAQIPVIIVFNERNIHDPFNEYKPDLIMQSMNAQKEFFAFLSKVSN
jgi:phosphoglycolate phosphatase